MCPNQAEQELFPEAPDAVSAILEARDAVPLQTAQEAAQEVLELRVRVAILEQALRPLAGISYQREACRPDRTELLSGDAFGSALLTMGDVRRARKLLAPV